MISSFPVVSGGVVSDTYRSARHPDTGQQHHPPVRHATHSYTHWWRDRAHHHRAKRAALWKPDWQLCLAPVHSEPHGGGVSRQPGHDWLHRVRTHLAGLELHHIAHVGVRQTLVRVCGGWGWRSGECDWERHCHKDEAEGSVQVWPRYRPGVEEPPSGGRRRSPAQVFVVRSVLYPFKTVLWWKRSLPTSHHHYCTQYKWLLIISFWWFIVCL